MTLQYYLRTLRWLFCVYIKLGERQNTFPLLQIYTQLIIHSMETESEKQIAFDISNLVSFRKKWATFKQYPSEK